MYSATICTYPAPKVSAFNQHYYHNRYNKTPSNHTTIRTARKTNTSTTTASTIITPIKLPPCSRTIPQVQLPPVQLKPVQLMQVKLTAVPAI